MNDERAPSPNRYFLGVECGGTKSVACLADQEGNEVQLVASGPANLKLLSDAQLVRHFRSMGDGLPPPAGIAIGMAGARTKSDFDRIRRAAAKVWPGVPCHATDDLETALAAAEIPKRSGDSVVPHPTAKVRRTTAQPPIREPQFAIPRVLVLSGTGSCCFGKTADGRTAKVGGWGHILGDKGSGFEIGLRALKAVVYYFDRDGEWSGLGQRILRSLQLNEPNDLIDWAQNASKPDIATLAVEVFGAASQRDKIAADILAGAAETLAKDAAACARRLVRPGTPVLFVLAGSVLLKQTRFARQVSEHLRSLWPGALVAPLKRQSAWGAVELARRGSQPPFSTAQAASSARVKSQLRYRAFAATEEPGMRSALLSPTEQRHPLSMNLDKLPVLRAIELMLSEDAKIPGAILAERKQIARAVALTVRAFRRGGRLFYVGAGTSGRLGVLDASECPPTFRTPPEMVQGIMAGGQRALWEAVEGAEDDAAAGGRAVEFHGVGRRDVVVGIAASGRTPFVRGALTEAKRRGAVTILLCFNPRLEIPRSGRPDFLIAPDIGPEVLTGSTRLKAGTATKLILNIFTTLAMVRLGKVLGNLMIDVKPSNAKLRDRATRIVRELTGVDYEAARAALEKTGWKIKSASARLRHAQRRRPATGRHD
jgi:N-acetylmuramic acid 6-phosphate etherase